MSRPLRRALSERGEADADDGAALILGAGGTARAAAFAAVELGMLPIVWNRSSDKAKDLAEEFRGLATESIAAAAGRAAGASVHIRVVMSTVPAAARIQLPEAVLAAQPVVLEATYGESGLLEQARAAGCRTVDGREMLLEQGVAQFEIWTGLRAPAGVMRQACAK